MYKKKTRVSNSEAAKDRHSEKTEQRRGHNLAAQSKKKKNLQPKKEIDYQIACLERIPEWMLDSELFNGSAKCC